MKILMVCLGNICRSPLAEGILKNKTRHLDIEVDSAGTANYHNGSLPDQRAIEVAKKYNVDLSDQRARQFSKKDFQKFDIIYAMDSSNYSDLINLANNQEEKQKVKMILNVIKPNSFASVPDPYYGGSNGFETVYNLLNEACDKIVSEIV